MNAKKRASTRGSTQFSSQSLSYVVNINEYKPSLRGWIYLDIRKQILLTYACIDAEIVRVFNLLCIGVQR